MEGQIKKVLNHWSLSPSNVIEELAEDVWSIDNKYILKATSNLKGVQVNSMTIKSLDTKGIAVAFYIPTKEGSEYICIEDKVYYLMHKLEGKHLSIDLDEGYERRAVIFGESIGKLHRIYSKIQIQPSFKQSDMGYEINEKILPKLRKNQEVSLVIKGIEKSIQQLTKTYESLPRQVIHRDLHTGNLLFNNKEEISGIIDCDKTEINARIFDVCYFIRSVLVENYLKDKEVFHEDRYGKWKCFSEKVIQGYNRQNNLTKQEIQLIPNILVGIELLFIDYFLDTSQKEYYSDSIGILKFFSTG